MTVTRCFTFGSEHAHPLGSYVKITAETQEDCRKEMFKRFGLKWAFDYSEEQIAEQIRVKGLRLYEVPLEPLKKFIVRCTVDFSREVESESEEQAIAQVLEREQKEDDYEFWDTVERSQLEAEEIQ